MEESVTAADAPSVPRCHHPIHQRQCLLFASLREKKCFSQSREGRKAI
jgi:hypothetical protein